MPTFEEGRARRAEIVRRAALYGMPEWRWPPAFEPANEAEHARWQPPNTLAVMRLATFAHQSGVGEEFARGVFNLAFGEGRDISVIDDAIIDVASSCGLMPRRRGLPRTCRTSSRRSAPLLRTRSRAA